MADYSYIAVEGVIGVGKTTFATKLSRDLSAKLVLEEVDNNPFLEKFYKDMRSYAFPAQLFFLLSRAKQLEPLSQLELFQQKIVSDYIVEKDRIFAYITLDENELGLYEKIYPVVVNEQSVKRPDLIIYLQASVETIFERIKKRGRQFEKHIHKDYIHNLTQAYNHFFSHYSGGATLAIINTDEVDFANDEAAYKMIKDYVLGLKGGVNWFTPKLR